jgi:dTDP-4-dehydrorhamnose reductase
VTGAGGLLGSRIVELASERGHEVYGLYLNHPPSMGFKIKMDITDFNGVEKLISQLKPHAIIHCAAITDVDLCERNRDLALKVNYEATKIIAKASEKIDAHMIYISTDYVFDGLKGMYREEDKPNPINTYGLTKLLGETAVMENCSRSLIARASVIYGSKPAAGKVNFALWVMGKLKSGERVKVLKDQYVSPTLNTNLALMILDALEMNLTGIIHMSGATRVSRYEFAIQIARKFNLDEGLIEEAYMHEMNWIAKRPRDSSLDVSKASRMLNVKPMSLNEALEKLYLELKENA